MDTTSIIQANAGNEWMNIILSLLLLIALYFIQKYAYRLDQKLSEYSKSKPSAQSKPWPLYVGLSFGLLVFSYNFFSPQTIDLKNWGFFETAIFGLMLLAVIGLCIESIRLFDIKIALIRSFIYLLLMALSFYAGFIFGLIFISLLALIILIYFIRYFKKLLTIQ